MPTEPIQGGPYPLQSDRADVPGDIKKVVDWAAPKLNMTFASTGERDAAILSPADGMECTVGSGTVAAKYIYFNGQWRQLATADSSAISRITYIDNEVFGSTASGVSILSARAVVDRSASGESTCTIRFTTSGLSVTDGNQSTEIGTLVSDLAPSGAVPIQGYRTNGALLAAVTGSGSMSVRWSSASASNQMFFGGSYTIAQ